MTVGQASEGYAHAWSAEMDSVISANNSRLRELMPVGALRQQSLVAEPTEPGSLTPTSPAGPGGRGPDGPMMQLRSAGLGPDISGDLNR